MWNRSKKETEETASRTSAQPSSDFGREAIPTSPYATRQSEYAATRSAAVIGKSLVITGQIRGQEDLVIDGRLDGDVELPEHRLTIGATGHLQGNVRAREIVILGTVQGNLEASERVEIKRNAKVIGDLKAQRPVIEDEAYFKGSVETIRVDSPKPAAKPQAAATAAASAESHPNPSPDIRPEPRRG